MLYLHHAWASTCSQKVRLCLAEKELEWDGCALDLRQLEHLAPRFLALNPDGMVPVLEHEGLVLNESTVINEYLDDRFANRPLMPADAAGRARVRAWNHFIDAVPTDAIKVPSYQFNLAPAIKKLDANALDQIRTRMPNRETARRWLRLAESESGLDTQEMDAAIAALKRTLTRMSQALSAHEWLAGTHFSLADVNMTPFIYRLLDFEHFDLARDWPQVNRWLTAVCRRPAFTRARLPAQRIDVSTT